MIKLQKTTKLFWKFFLVGTGNDIEIPTFSINIEI